MSSPLPNLHRECWFKRTSIRVTQSGRRDSNPRPSPWQGDALPLSHFRLARRTLGKERLELSRISPRDPKSRSSASFDTSPCYAAVILREFAPEVKCASEMSQAFPQWPWSNGLAAQKSPRRSRMPDTSAAFFFAVAAHNSLRDSAKALSLGRDKSQAGSHPTPSRFRTLVDVPALLRYPRRKP